MADLEALKRAAEAATPGPWYANDHTGPYRFEDPDAWVGYAWVGHDGEPDGRFQATVADLDRRKDGSAKWREQAAKDARFIALANPATILDLISRLEEAEKALEPFIALAKAVTDEGSPDYREWLREAKDWVVAFSFAGQSINLGHLRALAALSQTQEEKTNG